MARKANSSNESLLAELEACRLKVCELELALGNEKIREAERHVSTQSELQKSEALYRQAEQLGRMGHWEWDHTIEKLVSCSEQFARIYDMSIEEALCLFADVESELAIVHPDDRARYEHCRRESFAQNKGMDLEYRIVTPSGSLRYVHLIEDVSLNDRNVIVSSFGSVQDITERKLKQAALEEHEYLLTQMANMASIGYAIWDEVNQNYNSITDEFARIFGYSQDTFLHLFNSKEGDLQLVHPDDRAHYEAYEKMLHNDEGSELVEYRALKKNNEIIHIQQRYQYFRDTNGKPLQSIIVIQDITEQKKSELLLMEAMQVSEESNRAKTEFLANVSHELRTPLNGIIGLSELIRDSSVSLSGGGRFHEYASHIHDSGAHLLGLINDILDLSKIDAGCEDLDRELVNVPAIVESVVRMMENSGRDGAAEIVTEFSEDLAPLYVDKRRLKQILLNVLSNAKKFSEDSGVIIIRIRSDRRDGHTIEIVDQGVGILPEDIPKAFSQFSQVSGSLNRRHEGTGLGLPLTKALVEMHGGTMRLESEVGVGTTVTMFFPAVQDAES